MVASTSPNARGKRMTPARLSLVTSTLALASITLGLGLVGPCMTVVPRMGGLTGWVRLFRPDVMQPTTFSVLSGIDALRTHGNVGLALLLFSFSVVFPILKLAAMAWGTAALALGSRPHLAVKVTHHLGKFSMLDVFVVSVIVLGIKGLPGGTEVRLGWGVWLFGLSVVLSLLGSVALHGVRPVREA